MQILPFAPRGIPRRPVTTDPDRGRDGGGGGARLIPFRPGQRRARVAGGVLRGERDLYAVVLRAGQTLSVAVAALEDNAALEVFAPGGGGGGGGGGAAAAASRPRDAVPEPPPGAAGLPLTHPGAADLKLWSGRVPVTGPYLIAVCPTRGNAAYELELDCG